LSKTATRPDRWTLRSIPDRLERDGDPWRDIEASARALDEPWRRLRDLGR
jgi:bifunctional non-homologous end joining protein LigD